MRPVPFDLWSDSPGRNAFGAAALSVALLVLLRVLRPAVAGEIVQGAAAAVVLGGAATVYAWLRNFDLERKLRASIAWLGIMLQSDRDNRFIGVSIRNRTNVSVVIREVRFICNPPHLFMYPSLVAGGRELATRRKEPESARDAPCCIVSLGQPGISGFVEMPPFTDTCWGLPTHANTKWRWWEFRSNGAPFAGFREVLVVLEYPRLFGDRAVLTVRSLRRCNEGLDQTFRDELARLGFTVAPPQHGQV